MTEELKVTLELSPLAKEVATLRAQLKEVTKEREGLELAWKQQKAQAVKLEGSLCKAFRQRDDARAQLVQVQEEAKDLKRANHEAAVLFNAECRKTRELEEQLTRAQREAGALLPMRAELRAILAAHPSADNCADCLDIAGDGVKCLWAQRVSGLFDSDAGKGWVSPEEHAKLQREAGAMRETAPKMLAMFGDVAFGNKPSQEAFNAVAGAFNKAFSADAGKAYHHESECQARVDAAVRAEAKKLMEEEAKHRMWVDMEEAVRLRDAAVRATWEEAAQVAETASIPIPLEEWETKKKLSAATARGIAAMLRARATSGTGGGT